MEAPLVSVVMSTYNREKYLEESIKSVLQQTYKNIQFIVVDDGSTDNSKEVLDRISGIDPRLEVYYLKKNRHICYALNYGLDKALGKYIARIDSDDLWHIDKLEKQISFMEAKEQYGVTFTWVNLIDDDGVDINEAERALFEFFKQENRSQQEWIQYFLKNGNSLAHTCAVIRKSVLDQVGGYNLVLVQGQDFEMWLRLVIKAPIHIIEEHLLDIRRSQNPDNQISVSTELNDIRFFNEYMQIRMNFFDYMTEEEFKNFFKDNFLYKDANTELELECEKAFILKDSICNVDKLPILFLLRLEKLYRNPEVVELLESKYHFSLKDYYQLNTLHLYRDQIVDKKINQFDAVVRENHTLHERLYAKEVQAMQLDAEINALKEDRELKEANIKSLEAAVNGYEQSTIWKLSSPLRKLLDLIKK